MTYKCASSYGTYAIGSGSITLTSSTGAKVLLRAVKGADRMNDQLVEQGGVTWTRV